MLISTSILSIKNNIEMNIRKINQSTTDFIHLDIMDGEFVANKTWNINDIKPLLINTTKPLDVHLMVKGVIKYIDDFSILNPEYITVHLEACSDVRMVIDHIHQKGIKAGIAIKPLTDISELEPYFDIVDLILVMSVEPGCGGQLFLDTTYDRLKRLSIYKENYSFLIEVDGGLNDNIIPKLSQVDIAVVGSYITKSDNYQLQIDKLRKN